MARERSYNATAQAENVSVWLLDKTVALAPLLQLGGGYSLVSILSILLAGGALELMPLWLGSPFLVLAGHRANTSPFVTIVAALIFSLLTMPILLGLSWSAIAAFICFDLSAAFVALWTLRVGKTVVGNLYDPHDGIRLVISAGIIPAIFHMIAFGLFQNDLAEVGRVSFSIAFLAPLLAAMLLLPIIYGPAVDNRDRFRDELPLLAGVGLVLLASLLILIVLSQAVLPALFFIFPVLMWTAVRVGVRETGWLAFALTILALTMVVGDSVTFMASLDSSERLFFCLLILIMSVCSPVVTALLIGAIRRKNDTLSYRNDELQSLLRAMPDSCLQIDRNGTIIKSTLSPQCEDVLSGLEVSGSSFDDWLPSDARPHFSSGVAEIQSGRDLIRFDFTVELHDRDFHFECTLTRGISEGLTVVLRNVSAHHQAQMILRKRASMLSKSNAELEQFAYVASHDLQEPLRTVASFCELIQRRYSSSLDEDGRTFIEFAVDGSKRMQTMIADLLSLSRVQTRGKPFADVPLERLIQSARHRLRSEIRESGAKIEYSNLPTIYADGGQIEEVFTRLIDNALKFRSEESPVIRIDAQDDGNDWMIVLSDNGIGFEPAFKERIFQIFQKLHTRDQYPGNGVGLALVRKIIDRHMGRIWAEQHPDGGSNFYILLPKCPELSTQSSDDDSIVLER